jgi:hypothetical protein
MAVKVYYIGLRATLNLSKRYIERNQLRLQNNVSPEAYACIVSTLNSIITCLALLPVNPVNP